MSLSVFLVITESDKRKSDSYTLQPTYSCIRLWLLYLVSKWIDSLVKYVRFLGLEKFCDIKCRTAGMAPSAAVVVSTIRALKMHGGGPEITSSGLPKEYQEVSHNFYN